jgi:hypothetical protein
MDLEVVEVRAVTQHLGEQVTLLVVDLLHSTVDVDATLHLVEPSEAHNAGPQPRNEVHSSECAVPTVLASEDDGTLALDLGDGVVAELDGAVDLGVKLGEDVPRLGHVAGGTGVEDPSDVVVLLRRSEISKDLLLLDVDDAMRCDQWRRGATRAVLTMAVSELSWMTSWARRRLYSSSSPWATWA